MGLNPPFFLWGDKMSEKCPRHKAFEAICADILLKFKETKQIYIVGHDIPLSISKHLFNLLDARRRAEAAKLGVPENQYEFEDIIGLLLGIT